MAVLRQAEGGLPVPKLCPEHGISSAAVYKWRAKYGGMDASYTEIGHRNALELRNATVALSFTPEWMAGEQALISKDGDFEATKI